MISKRNTGRILGVCLALIYVALIASAVPGLWSHIPRGASVFLLLGLGIGFYFAGAWVLVDRREELKRKMPISSKELHRRKEEFYHWLSSQRRR